MNDFYYQSIAAVSELVGKIPNFEFNFVHIKLIQVYISI
jgi:hypothetical protein